MEYLLGLIVIVGVAMLLRRYLYSRPIKFRLNGERYLRMPDKSFRYADGSAIADAAHAAQVALHWHTMEKAAADADGRIGDNSD